jgi:cysteine synthase
VEEIREKIKHLSSLIGNTPLLEIKFNYKNEERIIYAKAENLNMSGSIKDRMAIYIITKAYESGKLKPGNMIAEATSGNTGIAFCAIGRALGNPVTIYMPDWMSEERKKLISSYGATIKLVSKEEGGFLGSIKLTENLADQNETVFLPRQFSNEDNSEAHYRTTAPEIWWQLKSQGLTPDAFVAGVGTGGTVMGVGKYLKEKNKNIKVFPLEPSNSPTMTTGYKVGKHRIQGISDEFIPQVVDLQKLDQIISVDDGDAIIMAQKLATNLGLGVGISSGANFLGALMAQELLGSKAVVTTIFADDNKKYLSTDLLREEPHKPNFMSPNIELLSMRAFRRVCYTCCDPLDCTELSMYEELGIKEIPCCGDSLART